LEKGLLPGYFLTNLFQKRDAATDYNLRNPNNYKIPGINHTFAEQSIRYRIPKLINTMPSEIRRKIDTHSIFGFKLFIKENILQSYPDRREIPNCYICCLS